MPRAEDSGARREEGRARDDPQARAAEGEHHDPENIVVGLVGADRVGNVRLHFVEQRGSESPGGAPRPRPRPGEARHGVELCVQVASDPIRPVQ